MKLLILGLGGTTFDVINKLTDNKLPQLKKVIVNGICSFLESTLAPVTAPAWVSLATDENPRKLLL